MNPSLILNKADGTTKLISESLAGIDNRRCHYFDVSTMKVCDAPATHLAVYQEKIRPRCENHGHLGSGKLLNHVSAVINADGLRINDGDNIDDILYIVCDFCGGDAPILTYYANEHGECACENCVDKCKASEMEAGA